MKYSLYNSILPLTEKYNLIYNSLSDQFIIFNSETNIEKISETRTIFFEELKKRGHILDETTDEIQLLKDIVRQVDSDDSHYDLTLNPTLNCNFHCWYCYEKHIKNSQMNATTISYVQKFISNTITRQKNLKHFRLSFFGGEPLLYFNNTVKPILEYFNKICSEARINYSIGFTSNGYLLTPGMIVLLKQNYVDFFQITLDGYRDDHNKVRFASKNKGSYDVILYNIKQLLTNKINVTLRINYTVSNIAGVKNIINDLSDIDVTAKSYLCIDFQRVWQDQVTAIDIETTTNETIEQFKANGFYVSRRKLTTIKDSCYADKKNQALINYNGDVFKCTARDFSSTSRDGILNSYGEISWENNALEKRMNIKLNNKQCLSCRIAPLCNGGCSQQALEHQGYCLLDFDEKKKDKVVIDRFFECYINQNTK